MVCLVLGLWKHAVRDRLPSRAGAHELGLIRSGQRFTGHELTRLLEAFLEVPHEREVRLDVLLRPTGDLIRAAARDVHQQ
jgi:hypothetical protein